MDEKKAKIIFQEAGGGIIIQRYTYHRAKPELNLKAGTRLKKLNDRPIPPSFAAGVKTREELKDYFSGQDLETLDSVLIERLKLYANYVISDKKIRDKISEEEAMTRIKELIELSGMKPEHIKSKL